MSLPARLLAGLVRAYQHARSGRPSPCRFDPSCSTYALEALEAHGALRGPVYAIRRVARCHPWGGFGFDPVPPAPAGRGAGDDGGLRPEPGRVGSGR
jgi:uncharacterized protein